MKGEIVGERADPRKGQIGDFAGEDHSGIV